jgi:ATP-dependent Lhr-like helicase
VVDVLEGFDAAAAAWETEILPARMHSYDPAWLDGLCLSGRISWIRRLLPSVPRRGGPLRSTPIALVDRSHKEAWRGVIDEVETQPAADAAVVLSALRSRGASFFHDLLSASGLLRTQLEHALAELVAGGWVTSDGFVGMRALLAPSARRRTGFPTPRSRIELAGRWSALDLTGNPTDPASVEIIARALLRRWGVVFHALLVRERGLPPWRDLFRCYRNLESRGEIRGGRFVEGFSGEQYALPEAVGSLRSSRRAEPNGVSIALSAADPLNLLGIILPGARLPATTGNRFLLRDGEVIAVREAGEVRMLVDMPEGEAWQVGNSLIRRRSASLDMPAVVPVSINPP